MSKALLVVYLLICCISLAAQSPSSANPANSKADYSQEPFVIEQFFRKQRFENDGTSSREDNARIRILSQAGLQTYGLLTFSYPSATGSFEIGYIRVRKPDGSVVETPPEDLQDMAAEITRQAPFYSDLHEKHAAVKALSVGDVLEFRTEERTTKPLAPGQFWTEYGFTHDQIVLDEQLEISVPRERSVKVKSSDVQPVISDAGAYRVYTWHRSNLKHKDETDKKRETTKVTWQRLRGRLPPGDVLLSSFASWDEVARWYGGLQDERVKTTPTVTAKALELTKNAPDDEAKSRILYDYVSTQFHYIGIAFGIGRYQPHTAAEVLANQYGDCKDKHTLLASMLASVGISAYPALISTTREIDPDVPSPGQFNHVVTVIPRNSGLVWLDTTTEVAPYQFLASPLREKHALMIFKDKPAALVNTPADLPYDTRREFSIDAKLSEVGTLEGNAKFSDRGDFEYLLRIAFRAIPLAQWKELVQRISLSSGFGGDVSEVTASSPEKTDEPFHFSYKYTRKDFGDWANGRTLAPSPLITLDAPSDDDLLPLGPSWLGPLADIQFHSRVVLPSGYQPQIPDPIHLKRYFASYDSTYEFKDGALISERHLRTLLKEVPVNQRKQYIEFMKAVQDDYGSYIPLSSKSSQALFAATDAQASPGTSLKYLPNSLNPEAAKLENEARDALAKRDLPTAISSLYRAVSADPNFTRAWVQLGPLLMSQNQVDAGLDAFHKAMAADPSEPKIPIALSSMLMSKGRFEDAVAQLQESAKIHPNDANGLSNLGFCLLQLKRYSEAANAFETALKIKGSPPELQASLGSAYLLAGERDKAAESFAKLVDMDPTTVNFNDVAYQMAEADLNLPLALDYAKKAVRDAELESQKITLRDLETQNLRSIQKIAAYWDTLGWVEERMSNLEDAEEYLRASWKLTQDGVVADHLCQVYERMHKVDSAIQMCELALYRMSFSQQLALSQFRTETDSVQKRLEHLKAGAKVLKTVPDASDISIRERTYKLTRFLPGTESAEFFRPLAADGKSKTFKLEDVKFISGSEKMKLQGKKLKAVDFHFPAPSATTARFVRRGILGCYQYTGCSFVLLDPASAPSPN